MSRSLTFLLLKDEFKMFGMPRGSPRINHLAFAYDMINVYKDDLSTLKTVLESLEKYEKASWKRINKEKSAIYLHKVVSQRV